MVDLMVDRQQSGAAGKGVPAGFKLTEVGVIPEDWDYKYLGELGDIVRGGSPRPAGDPKYFEGDFIPWLTVASLTTIPDAQQVVMTTSSMLTELGSKHSRTLEKGTLIISNSGATLGVAKLLGMKCCANDGVAAIINQRVGNKSFLIHYINTITKSLHDNIATGNGQPNLNTDLIRLIPVPFPNEQEQKKIADTLSDCDNFFLKLEKLIAKKQAIKTATMQQLLTGKTRLPQFALREDGSVKGYKKSELGEIPEDWDISTYGQVFSFLSTSTNARSDLSDTGEYGYIHYGDIHTKWNNSLSLDSNTLPRISSELVSSSFVEDGDIIMADASEDYSGIGKSIEIQGVRDKKIVAGLHTYLLRDVNNAFVDGFRGYLHCIRTVKSSMDRLATGMKVFGVSKNNLKTIPIPVPPKEEQNAIATILSDMDKEIQTLQQRLDKTRQLKQGMMQELLTGKTRLMERS
ncbi:restriction endonuclease subunit S [Edwardsiella tarda]|uniref:restriction endonuclease subunit S n=1 Tax=Edwardsiella tarda TaxID=636 RepID=UPI00351C71A5